MPRISEFDGELDTPTPAPSGAARAPRVVEFAGELDVDVPAGQPERQGAIADLADRDTGVEMVAPRTPRQPPGRPLGALGDFLMGRARPSSPGIAGLPDRPVALDVPTGGLPEAPQESFREMRQRTGRPEPTIDMPGSVFHDKPAPLQGALANAQPAPTENVGAPVTEEFRREVRARLERMSPSDRAKVASRQDLVGGVARDILAEMAGRDRSGRALGEADARVENRATRLARGGYDPALAGGRALAEASLGLPETPDAVAKPAEEMKPIDGGSMPARIAKDFSAGVVGSTGATLAYLGRTSGAETAQDLGDAMTRWSERKMPANPTFADQLVQGIGSMGSFLIPGVGVTKGANALAILSPAMAKWAGAGTMAALEAAAEADATYKHWRQNGLPHELAMRQAEGTFWANMAVLGVTDKIGFFNDVKGLARKVVIGAVTEGPMQEGPQQVIQNYFTGRPLSEGVGEAVAIGAIIGGGAAGVLHLADQPQTGGALPPQKPPALDDQERRFAADLLTGDKPATRALVQSPYAQTQGAVQGQMTAGQPGLPPMAVAAPTEASGQPAAPAEAQEPAQGALATPAEVPPAQEQNDVPAAEGGALAAVPSYGQPAGAVQGQDRLQEFRAREKAILRKMRDFPDDIGKARREGRLSASQLAVLDELAALEREFPEFVQAFGERTSPAKQPTAESVTTGDGTRTNPVVVTAPEHLEQAEQQVNTEPTEAQKAAGNYQKAHVQYQGFDVSIENPKGSTRSGTAPDGTTWSVEMPATYGYIKRTEGADGDQVDVYLGGNPSAQRVWIVDQIDPETGRFDEHKALMGFGSREEALKTYRAGFSDGKGAQRAGAVTEMAIEQFRQWVDRGDTKAPLAYRPAEKPVSKPARKPAEVASETARRAEFNLKDGQRARVLEGATRGSFVVYIGNDSFGSFRMDDQFAISRRAAKLGEYGMDLVKEAAETFAAKQRGEANVADAPAPAATPSGEQSPIVRSDAARALWDRYSQQTSPNESSRTPLQRFQRAYNEGVDGKTTSRPMNDIERAVYEQGKADRTPKEVAQQSAPKVKETPQIEREPVVEAPAAPVSAADAASVSAEDFDALINEVLDERKAEQQPEPEAPATAAAQPPAEPPAQPAPTDEFKRGDRVVILRGELAGRHGQVVERTVMNTSPVFGGGPVERSVYYRIKTDGGAQAPALKRADLEAETGGQPDVTVPDIMVEDSWRLPEDVLRMVEMARKDARSKLDAAGRARLPAKKAEHAEAAHRAEQRADRLQAAFDAWAAKHPEAAVGMRPGASGASGASGAPGVASTPGVDAAQRVTAAGLTITKSATKNGTPAWAVGGNTRAHSDMLKRLGGRWYGPKKVWSFYKGDPTAQIAGALGTAKASENASSAATATDEEAGWQKRMRQIREHFAVGNIIRSDYWGSHDQVLQFMEDKTGDWSVRVQRVERKGDIWAPVPGERVRVHKTVPGPKDEVVDRVDATAPEQAAPSIKDAAQHAAEGVKEGFAGLDALFGRKGTLGSGPAFDEETWAKAKPHFEAAFREFVQAGKSLKEFVRYIIDTYNEAILPYLRRWHEEHARGPDEQPQTTGATGDRALAGTPAADVRAPEEGRDTGVGSPEGGGADARGAGDADRAGDTAGRGLGDGEGEVRVPPGGRGGERGSAADGGLPDGPRSQPDDAQPGDGGRGLRGVVAGGEIHHRPASEDFRITDLTRLGEGGQKTKYRNNVAAIRLLKELDATGRAASADEQNVLARYVGWGGIPQAFDPDNSEWRKEFAELRELLTDEEYDAARQSTQYAHYTSQTIIVDGIYAAMRRFGYRGGGRGLEPGGGAGNFLGLIPEDMAQGTRYTLVERERIAAGIAKHLYPNQSVQLADFTQFNAADGYFDFVSGNPPFARTPLTDLSGRKHLSGMSVHNYFISKSVDMLRPGGILQVVVSNYFMDAESDRTRRYIAERTRFLGAIRLPNNAFSRNALTEVTTDLIFLQKLPEEQWGSKAAKDGAKQWVESGRMRDPLGGDPMPVNTYFVAHPEMMLGRMARSGTMYGPGQPALTAVPGQDTAALLREAVQRLPENVYEAAAIANTQQASDDLIEALTDPDVQEGGYFVRDGKLYERLQDMAGEARARVITPSTRWSEKQLLGQPRYERIIKLSKLRETLRKLIALEMQDASKLQLTEMRRRLNAQYDAYVKQHGYLNERSTQSLFGDDPDYPLLAALEHNFDAGIGAAAAKRQGIKPVPPKATKAPIFTQRVIEPHKEVLSVETPADALVVSLAERGSIDTAYISKLLGRDGEEVLRELAQGERPALFWDPALNEYVLRDAYLSGNVRLKLKQADEAGMHENARALEEVLPEDVPAHEIGAKLGASWIPTGVYEQFAIELLGDGTTASVRYVAGNSSFITNIDAGSVERSESIYGTKRMPAEKLIAAMLNLRDIRVLSDPDQDGRRHLLVEETALANDKAQAIRDAFGDWVFKDPERSDLLVRTYNDVMNNYVTRKFDGSMLTLPGKVPDSVIRLRRHQRNAVARIVQDRTALLDHVVGAGKTYTIVAGAMELRRTGLARKPLIVVPNHLVKQWAADFYRLYPGANILTATKKDFSRENRRRFLGKIATGNWDAVIMAHSSFGFIRPDPDFEEQFNKQQITEIATAIASLGDKKKADGQTKRTIKQMEKMKERLEQRIKRLRDKPVDALLDYGQIGADQLFVDEAHLFKNLMFITKMQNVRGLGDPDGSQRAYDMYLKTQHTMLRNGRGQGVVFATGTPVSNSLAEMYHMLRYLSPQTIKEMGHETFDAWAVTFADVEKVWMQSMSGQGYKATNRLGKFANAPELLKIYDQVADTVTIEDIKSAYAEENDGKEFPILKLKGGRRQPVSIPISSDQKAYMLEIAERAKAMEKRKGPPKKGEDNMLSIMTDARKAAMDIRLVKMDIIERDPNGRVAIAARNIVERYRKYADVSGTQLVFSDMGTPVKHAKKERAEYQALVDRLAPADDPDIRARAELGDEDALEQIKDAEEAAAELEAKGRDWIDAIKQAERGFSIYDDLRAALVEQGIPEAEIAFIHDYNTDEQKAALFRSVKAGVVRVLMGSTEKMGAGTNVQDRAVALHHLDVPWKPSDVEQREGRIIRQGNKLPDMIDGFEVEVLAYATQDTPDLFMWQTQEKKLNMISQMRSRNIGREIDNSFEELQLSAGEMQAAATSNPYLLQEIQLKDRIQKLERQQRQFDAQKNDATNRKRRAKEALERLPKRIAEAQRFAIGAKAYFDSVAARHAAMKATVAGKEVVGREDIGKSILSVIDSFMAVAGSEPSAWRFATQEEYNKAKDEWNAAKERQRKEIKEKGIEFNGKVYRSQSAIGDAYHKFAGDKDPIVLTAKGNTFTTRDDAVNAFTAEWLDAAETGADVDLGRFGDVAVTADMAQETVIVTMTFDGVNRQVQVRPGKDSVSDLQVLRTALNRALADLESSLKSPEYLAYDLARAERTLNDIESNQIDGEWPDKQALTEARTKYQEVLKQLSEFGKDAPKEQQAPPDEDPKLSRAGGSERLTVTIARNGLPVLANDEIILGYPQRQGGRPDVDFVLLDRARAREAYESGEDPRAFAQIGTVGLEVDNAGNITGLNSIFLRPDLQSRGRVARGQAPMGYGEKVVRAILASMPDGARLKVSSILPEARPFWEKMGTTIEPARLFDDGYITRGSYERSRRPLQDGAGGSGLVFESRGGDAASARARGRNRGPVPRDRTGLSPAQTGNAGNLTNETPADAGVSASVDRVSAELEARMGRPADTLGVKIVGGIADLPDGLRSFVTSQDATDTQGVFDPQTGDTYLVASNIAPGRAFAVYLHELGVHKGMLALLGEARMRALVSQVRAWARGHGTDEEVRLAKIAAARVPDGTPANVADEELLAYFVEEAVKAGHDIPRSRPERGRLAQWLHDLWAAVRGALEKLGVAPETLTASEVVTLARGAAERAIQESGGPFSREEARAAIDIKTVAAKRGTRHEPMVLPYDGKFAVVVDGRVVSVDESAAEAAESARFTDAEFWRGEFESFPDRWPLWAKRDGDPSIVRSVFEAPWYSALLRAVRGAKLQAAPATQWGGTIKAMPGVKADEVEWSGVLDWLATQPGKVTREQVVAYLEQNGVRVEEVVLGADSFENAEFEQARDEAIYNLLELGYEPIWTNELVTLGGVRQVGTGREFGRADYWEDSEAVSAMLRLDEVLSSRDPSLIFNDDTRNLPKYENFQLPGGENYRELLLTLPVRNDGPAVALDDVLSGRARLPNTIGPEFRSSHFDQPNIVAHVRFNERTDAEGRRVLFIEELQSDWQQSNRNALAKLGKPQSVRKLADDVFGGKMASMMPLDQVDGGVLAALKYDQVRRAVVASLPVNVVNDLGGEKRAADYLFGNADVLELGFSSDHLREVSNRILAGARSVGARLRAELLAASNAWRDANLLPALKASDLDARVVVGLLSPERLYHVGLLGSASGSATTLDAAVNVDASGDVARGSRDDASAMAAGGRSPDDGPVAGKAAEASFVGVAGLDAKGNSASLARLLDWHRKISGKESINYIAGPFVGKTESVVALSIKRIIRYAAEHGFDAIAWTTGEQQAARYDLSKQISKVRWDDASTGGVGDADLRASEGRGILYAYDLNGNKSIERAVEHTELPDLIGKEAAERLLNASASRARSSGGTGIRRRELSGIDLKIGGEGMKSFYDRIVPAVAKDVLKKLGGGKVEDVSVRIEGDDPDAMAARIYGAGTTYRSLPFESRARVDEQMRRGVMKQPGFTITPELRAKAMQGMPLFSQRGQLEHPLLSRAGFQKAQQVVTDLIRSDRTFNRWWHTTVGTQYHKATINHHFGRVFRLGQDYLQDVNYYSAVAAEEAPDLLLQLESLKDLVMRHRISNKNARAIAAPIFEGTLNDTVWTDDELRQRYSLDDRQIEFYRQFRAAVDRSLDDLAKSQIAKMARAVGIARGAVEALRLRNLTLADYQQELANLMRLREQAMRTQAAGFPQGSEEQAQFEQRADSLKNQRTATVKLYNRVAKLKMQGYAPLMRFGQYTVDVVDAAGDRQFFGMYESQPEANKAARVLAGEFPGATVSTGVLSKEQHRAFQGLTPETVEVFGRITGLDDDAMFQDYLRLAVNNRSALKRMIHREGIPGFSKDVTRVLAAFVTSNARMTSANFHHGDMLKATVEIPKEMGDVRDEAEKLRQYLLNPREEAPMLRGWLFATFLGGSVAAALVNMTQPVMMTAPYLNQYASVAKVSSEMAKAASEGATGKIGFDVRAAFERAREEGIVSPHEIYQLMAESRGQLVDRWAITHRLMRLWGGFFSLAEALNRRITFIAAYRIGVANGERDPYRFAVKAVHETQGIYNKGNRPNWARGGVGATIFTFKQYSIAYLEFLKRLPPKQRTLAVVLLWLAAGLMGSPGAEDIEDLIDAFGQWLGYGTNTKAWLRQNAARVLGEHGSQWVLHGISAGIPLDVHARLGLQNLIPGTALFKRSEVNKGDDIAEVFGPAGGVVGKLIEGRPGEALLPKALRDLDKAVEMWQTGEFRDGRRRLVDDQVTTTEAIIKGVGFNPSRLAKQSRITYENVQDINLVKVTKTRILDDWSYALLERRQAQQRGDEAAEQKATEKLRKAQEDMKAWNERNPEMRIRIEGKDIQRRMRELQTMRKDRITRSAPKTIRGRVAEDLRQ